MLESFLTNENKFIVDKDSNVIYLISSLSKITMTILDAEGKNVSLTSILATAVPAVEDQWDEFPWYGTLAGALYVSLRLSPQPPMVFTFNAGFAFGMMIQRLVTRRGLKVSISHETITSSEADDIIKRATPDIQEEGQEGEDGTS